MTVCTTESIEFTRCKRRKAVADFGGGEITSDAGVLLLSQADKRLRLTERIAPKLNDSRCKGKISQVYSKRSKRIGMWEVNANRRRVLTPRPSSRIHIQIPL